LLQAAAKAQSTNGAGCMRADSTKAQHAVASYDCSPGVQDLHGEQLTALCSRQSTAAQDGCTADSNAEQQPRDNVSIAELLTLVVWAQAVKNGTARMTRLHIWLVPGIICCCGCQGV
jgi:hypothetical protein